MKKTAIGGPEQDQHPQLLALASSQGLVHLGSL
jgi:hypothetical protein